MSQTVRSTRFFVVTVAAAVVVVGTLSLGQWQLRRASEKEQLQASILAQSHKAPLDSRDIDTIKDLASETYRPVSLQGVWLRDKTIFVDNRPMAEKTGFWVYTPLRLDGTTAVVLVQRGWVPRDFLERTKLPVVETPAGSVRIEGRMAPPPSKLYAFKGEDVGQIRQNIDLDAFRLETGLPLLQASVVQLGAQSEGLLRQWPAPDVGVDRHYGYAFQWFALSALTIGLYGWFQLLSPWLRPRSFKLTQKR